MSTITLSEVSVQSVGRSIAQLSKAFNSNAEKIEVIQNTILVGFEQSTDFDTVGNAYCQKAAALVNAVAKFSPDRAKTVVAYFKGKIPFSIVSNGENGYKLSKLNWDLIKAPEVLQAEHDKKSADAKNRAEKRKADNAETVKKAAKFDAVQEELKRLKNENAQLKDGLSPELLAERDKAYSSAEEERVKAEQAAKMAAAEKAKAVQAKADALAEQAKAEKVQADYERLQAAYTKALAEISELKGQLKEARLVKGEKPTKT